PEGGSPLARPPLVRSLYHATPSPGPATVWMTTGNKPTPALQYPALGSLTAKLMPATPGVPKFVSFGEIRGGNAGLAGFLGTAYNPFIIDGVGGGKGGGNLRVRGIQLPGGFTLKELEDRDGLRKAFDDTFRQLD